MSSDNKDQKFMRQTSSNAMQTGGEKLPRDSLEKQDSHNMRIEGHQDSFGNKGGLLENDSFFKLPQSSSTAVDQKNNKSMRDNQTGLISPSGLPQAISVKNFINPPKKASIRLLQTTMMKDEKNLTSDCYDRAQQSSMSERKRESIQSRDQLGIF